MPYNFVANSDIFTQRNFVADFLQEKSDFRGKTTVLRFWAPFEDLGATYDNYRGSLERLLVLIELFSLFVTAEALRAIMGSKSAISLQRGPVDPKFQAEGVAATNRSSSQKN